MTMLADGWVWREAKSGLHIRFSMGCSCFFIAGETPSGRAQYARKAFFSFPLVLILKSLYAILCRKSLYSGISRTVDPNQVSY